MAIIGFIAVCVVLLYLTGAYVIVFLNTMGEYNIGGVPNTLMSKVITAIAGAVLWWLWTEALSHSPFDIIIKQ